VMKRQPQVLWESGRGMYEACNYSFKNVKVEPKHI
jgi:hypothetical protein